MPTIKDWRDGILFVILFFMLMAICDPAPVAEFIGDVHPLERTMDRYWTEDEQRRLSETLKQARAESLVEQRDAAAIRTLIHSGMRVGEFLLTPLGCAMAALRTDYLFIPRENRKGKKRDHRVFVTAELRRDLQQLIKVRCQMVPGSAKESDPLIVSTRGKKMTVRAFQLRIKQWAQRAGLPAGSSPHWARHTRAMNIMRRSSSSDPRGIAQRALDHVSIATTGVYTEAAREDVEQALTEVDSQDGKRRISTAALRRAFEGRA